MATGPMHPVCHGKGPPWHDAASRPQSVGQLVELAGVVDNVRLVIRLVSLQHTVRGPGVGGRANEKPGGRRSGRGPVGRGPVGRNPINNMPIGCRTAVNSLAYVISGTRVAVVKARQPLLLQEVEGVVEDDVRICPSHPE